MVGCFIGRHSTAAGLEYNTSDQKEEKDSDSHSYQLRRENNSRKIKNSRESLLKYTVVVMKIYGV